MKKEKTRQDRIYLHASSLKKRGSDELDDAKINAVYRAIIQQVEDAHRTTAKAKSRKKHAENTTVAAKRRARRRQR